MYLNTFAAIKNNQEILQTTSAVLKIEKNMNTLDLKK